MSIDGVDTSKLVTHLWDKHRIVITAIGHDNPDDPKMSYRGLRVTPNIYTPLEEIDTFVEAMRERGQERAAGVECQGRAPPRTRRTGAGRSR